MALGDKSAVIMQYDRGVANGIATLDENGILSESQRPSTSALEQLVESIAEDVAEIDKSKADILLSNLSDAQVARQNLNAFAQPKGLKGQFLGFVDTNVVEAVDPLSGKRTARFIVGTSTAGWTEADCDYLCDGVADDVEINAAITALPTTGGEIVILDGEYDITATINVNKSCTTLTGVYYATKLNRNESFSGSTRADNATIFVQRDECIIQNFYIYDRAASGNGLDDYTRVGIMVYNHSHSIIRNNCIIGSSRGIRVDYANSIHIMQNNIEFAYIGIESANSSKIKISNNSGSLNFNKKGINISDSNEIEIFGNHIESSRECVIVSGGNKIEIIENNIIQNGSTVNCVSLSDALNQIIVSDNIFENTDPNNSRSSAIYFYGSSTTSRPENITISNNSILNMWEGIKIEGCSSKVLIADNVLSILYDGIVLENTSYSTISNNIIEWNEDIAGITGSTGMQIDDSFEVCVIGNTVSYSPSSGIQFYNCSKSLVEGNICIHNTIYNFALYGDSTNNIVASNNFYGSADTDKSIYADSETAYNYFSDNMFGQLNYTNSGTDNKFTDNVVF